MEHWVSVFIDKDVDLYFYSFGIEYILQGVLSNFWNKSITCNIFRMQFHDSVMCGFFALLS